MKSRSVEEGAKAEREVNNKVEEDCTSNYYLQVAGFTIDDNSQVLDQYGAYSEWIYTMAVPYIGATIPIIPESIFVRPLRPA